MKFTKLNPIVIVVCVVLVLVLVLSMRKYCVATLTDEWIRLVTVEKSPTKVANHFCKDGILFGTVSQTLRQGRDPIKNYFEFFAKLPGLQVIDKKFNISKISHSVSVNNAFITWKYDGADPIVARMTFIYRNGCLFELHSSALPDLNKDLKNV